MRSRSLVLTSLVLLGLAAGLGWAPRASAAETCDLTVVRVYFTERATVDAIASWTEPWEVHHDLGYLVVGVNPDGFVRLATEGYDLEIDEKLTERYCTPPEAVPDQVDGIPGYPCYRTVEETYHGARPSPPPTRTLATCVDIGDSWEKTDRRRAARLRHDGAQAHQQRRRRHPTGTSRPDKPRFLIVGAIHAREYTTAELALRFAE